MTPENQISKLMEQIQERERLTERARIIREIQAFAGDYGHLIEGRDCVIVEQLIDFLSPPKVMQSNGISLS